MIARGNTLFLCRQFLEWKFFSLHFAHRNSKMIISLLLLRPAFSSFFFWCNLSTVFLRWPIQKEHKHFTLSWWWMRSWGKPFLIFLSYFLIPASVSYICHSCLVSVLEKSKPYFQFRRSAILSNTAILRSICAKWILNRVASHVWHFFSTRLF